MNRAGSASAAWRGASALASVTVTFHPELEVLARQLQVLPADCLKVVVDNASTPAQRRALDALLSRFPPSLLVQNPSNLGLAAALNQGVAAAARHPLRPARVLLLDQDSEPAPDCIARLLAALDDLEAAGVAVGCVGPVLHDPATGLDHGFHQARGVWWKRVHPSAGQTTPVPCSNLNGSGTLTSLALFEALGGLDADLFIDHVDTDWSFRVLAQGRLLFGIPQARMHHRMGAASRRIWLFGWRVWPDRSPERHRHLFRNTVTLLRRSYVPSVWKFWALVRMPLALVLALLWGPRRAAQLPAILGGILDGLRARRPRVHAG